MIHDTNLRKKDTEAYHETKTHASAMFAYNVYPCTIPQDFFFVSTHWQDSAEIIYIKHGEGLVQVDFTTYSAKAGDIFLILPGHPHGIRQKDHLRMEYENIIFDLNFLGSNHYDLCSRKYWQPLTTEHLLLPACISTEHPLNRRLRSYLDASDELCDKHSKGYELGVKGNLFLVFSLLFEIAEDTPFYHRPDLEKMKLVLKEIEEHYDQKLTVDSMAQLCGYSSSHFMRWFKDVTSASFTDYLIDYRLEKAIQELKLTTDTVLEIAQRTGFENISNFNRLFKKRLGVTPSALRKQEL